MHTFKEQALPIVRKEISYEEAKTLFKHDQYKLDIIEQYKHEQLTFYTQGDFTDLCRGGHVSHTGLIKHFKLLSLAGAYFRGDAKMTCLHVFMERHFLVTQICKHIYNYLKKEKHVITVKSVKLKICL